MELKAPCDGWRWGGEGRGEDGEGPSHQSSSCIGANIGERGGESGEVE